jgi:hypothetical protein
MTSTETKYIGIWIIKYIVLNADGKTIGYIDGSYGS